MNDDLDGYDRRILIALQADGRLTNQELAERVALSPSQCSRRRRRLEEAGVIRGYHAVVDRRLAGFGLISIVSVTLASHDPESAARLKRLLDELPAVLEAHSTTGEMDYTIKVVSRDLDALSAFISTTLLPHEAVRNVKTAIVLDTLKESFELPLG